MIAPFPEPRSAYIHVPFCAHRCGYCDFTLVAGRDDLIETYLEAMAIELRRLEHRREIDTLFFGGGTPTHLSVRQLSRLLALVREWFHLAEGFEFGVEANPADLDSEKIAVLAGAGVNRISLGVQSFDATTLSLLERDHRRDDILKTVERIRPHIDNISLDLIFGVPDQTLSLWRETLQQAIELQPRHLSTYGLTFEKGTSFWKRSQRGELRPATEELEREMYATAIDTLVSADFEQYEISNFAQPGYHCRHNEVYWTGRPYFGFGPGAARYVNGRRETNHRSVTTWLKRVLSDESPLGEVEELSHEDRARELAVLGLRRCAGICLTDFQHRTGFDLWDLAGDEIDRHRQSGLLEVVDDHLRLTREGRFLADWVIVDFL